jgi:hypothetical protein
MNRSPQSIDLYICTYVHTNVHMYICTYKCTYVHMYIQMYIDRITSLRASRLSIRKVSFNAPISRLEQGDQMTFFLGGGGQPLPPPWPSIISNYSLWVHHLVNWDDRQLLALAMTSDFSVAWQCLSKRTSGFSLQIKLHARPDDLKCLTNSYTTRTPSLLCAARHSFHRFFFYCIVHIHFVRMFQNLKLDTIF